MSDIATSSPFWPCPDQCERWCRSDTRFLNGIPVMATNHHPHCKHVDASLMDVYRIRHKDGGHYYMDILPDVTDLGGEYTVTLERMHREVYEHLPEFQGF